MKPQPGKIVARRDGAIGWITFDHPGRHNALSLGMWQGLLDAMRAWAEDPELRVVVLHGAGELAFVSGADISEFEQKRSSPETIAAYDAVAQQALAALRTLGRPTIAMVRGYCMGAGVAVALACDLRIAAEDARFAVPAARLGLGYSFEGVRQLVDVVGPSFAKEIFYTARQFTAQEAAAMGLVTRVVPADGLEAHVRDYAERIAANAPLTVASIKTLVAQAMKDESQRDEALCKAVVDRCFASKDCVEGRQAFMEKRKPRFTGR